MHTVGTVISPVRSFTLADSESDGDLKNGDPPGHWEYFRAELTSLPYALIFIASSRGYEPAKTHLENF